MATKIPPVVRRPPARIHPVVLLTLLEATGRYDPRLKGWLEDEFDLSLAQLEELARFGDFLSLTPVERVLTHLLQSNRYGEIVRLAGANAYLWFSGEVPGALLSTLPRRARMNRAMREVVKLLRPCLADGHASLFRWGNFNKVEVSNSPFARGRNSLFPLCGFIEGFLSQAFLSYRVERVAVEEVVCIASQSDQPVCEFVITDISGEREKKGE